MFGQFDGDEGMVPTQAEIEDLLLTTFRENRATFEAFFSRLLALEDALQAAAKETR